MAENSPIKKVMMVGTHLGLAEEADFYLARAFKSLGLELCTFDIRASSFVPSPIRHLIPGKLKKFISPRKHFAKVEEADTKLRNDKFLAIVKAFKPDVIIAMRAERLNAESVLEAKKETRAAIINWTADDPRPYISESLVPAYDAWCIFDWSFRDWFMQRGARRVEHLILACDPLLHRPIQLSFFEKKRWVSNIAFVGSYEPRREEFFSLLSDLGLAIWGPNWHKASSKDVRACVRGCDYLPRGKWLRAYAGAKLVVNIQATNSLHGLSNRVWETLACGKCLITELEADVEQELSGCAVTFKGADELRASCVGLLANEKQRQSIGERGRELVVAQHTYIHRAQSLISLAQEIKS
jgi:spore maturation protein CgeB